MMQGASCSVARLHLTLPWDAVKGGVKTDSTGDMKLKAVASRLLPQKNSVLGRRSIGQNHSPRFNHVHLRQLQPGTLLQGRAPTAGSAFWKALRLELGSLRIVQRDLQRFGPEGASMAPSLTFHAPHAVRQLLGPATPPSIVNVKRTLD